MLSLLNRDFTVDKSNQKQVNGCDGVHPVRMLREKGIRQDLSQKDPAGNAVIKNVFGLR